MIVLTSWVLTSGPYLVAPFDKRGETKQVSSICLDDDVEGKPKSLAIGRPLEYDITIFKYIVPQISTISDVHGREKRHGLIIGIKKKSSW